jgi:hypothetical protein
MKKITFKNLLALLLCVIGYQNYAQIQSDTPYRLRTAIPAQESYNDNDTPFPDKFVYPTAKSGSDALGLNPKDTSNDSQLFEFKEITGVTFEYPAESGTFYQVYNVVAVGTTDGNGTGVLERNNLTSDGHRMRLKGASFPQNGELHNFIVISNPVKDDNFDVPNSFSIISTSSQPNPDNPLRRFVATTNYDFLNFGGNTPAESSRPWLDSWVIEATDGTEITLSSKNFNSNSIFISNPVNNRLNINGLTDNIKQISIYSLLGQEVLTKKIGGQSSISVDVSNLVSGVYLVKFKGNSGAFTKKIIKN